MTQLSRCCGAKYIDNFTNPRRIECEVCGRIEKEAIKDIKRGIIPATTKYTETKTINDILIAVLNAGIDSGMNDPFSSRILTEPIHEAKQFLAEWVRSKKPTRGNGIHFEAYDRYEQALLAELEDSVSD